MASISLDPADLDAIAAAVVEKLVDARSITASSAAVDNLDHLMSLNELDKLFGSSRTGTYAILDKFKVPRCKVDGKVRVRRRHALAVLDQAEQGPAA